MDTYVILRRSAWGSPEELGEAAGRSKSVGDDEMSDDIRWIRSYVLSRPARGSTGAVAAPSRDRARGERARAKRIEAARYGESMAVARGSELDLAGLRLGAGEGRRLELEVSVAPLVLGSERYAAKPARVPARLDVSRMLGGGYALRLRFASALEGPCMRCLKDAAPLVEVDAHEVDRPGEGEELESPYVHGEKLDLSAWAHDAFALGAPVKVLCREDCPGLCPVCAADLDEVGPDHSHEPSRDPRWAKLSELKLD
jgi:uncharacterized protein